GGAVEARELAAELFDARRHASMNFADEDGFGVEVARHGPAHAARLIEIDREIVADDASDGPAPSDHAGDRLLVDRVLRRDDIALRRKVRADEKRAPFGVV